MVISCRGFQQPSKVNPFQLTYQVTNTIITFIMVVSILSSVLKRSESPDASGVGSSRLPTRRELGAPDSRRDDVIMQNAGF